MIKELIKLADQLDKMGRANVANEIDNIISKASDPTDAPYLFEVGQGSPDDYSKEEFHFPEQNDLEVDKPESDKQDLVPPEIQEAAARYLGERGFKLTDLTWKTQQELVRDGWAEDESDGCWEANSLPIDPMEDPQNLQWLMWEIYPGKDFEEDDNFGVPIRGSKNRLYGES